MTERSREEQHSQEFCSREQDLDTEQARLDGVSGSLRPTTNI